MRRPSFHHDELQTSRIIKDEKAVVTVENLIQSWNNPFSERQDLISISTAKEAPAEVSHDLMQAYDVGEKAYQQFKEERLTNNPPKAKFHDPLTQKKLKTFSSLTKKKTISIQGRSTILKADRSLFGRMMIIGQSRKIEVRELLHHSLGPLPWSLATPEGFPRKTNKAALATYLQKDVQLADRIPPNSATIVDGMSLVQKLNVGSNQTTFGHVASSLLSMVLHAGSQSSRIDVVFDVYRENSIKNAERTIRGEEQGVQFANITASQLIRQWRKFLSQLNNKTNLIRFLVTEWKNRQYTERLHGKVMYATCDNRCWKITEEDSVEVLELSSCQEEADTRLLLHAAHASQEGYEAVVINSEDTDVFILLTAFSNSIDASLFQKCGSQTRTKLIDIDKIATALGQSLCRAIIGLHSFTGCDTVSAFAGKGKIKALKMAKADEHARRAFSMLGQTWDLPAELFVQIEKITCALYTPGANTSNVNDARYNLFCAKNGEIESHQLPPCQDCLKKHVLRTNYQACIWKRSLERNPAIPSPVGMGWKLENESLVVDWMDGRPAPDTVLALLACKCKRSCSLPTCVCLVNGLKCTDICTLKDCVNQWQTEDDVNMEELDSEDEADDDEAEEND